MCENKKNCSCGCKTKKSMTESKNLKKILRERNYDYIFQKINRPKDLEAAENFENSDYFNNPIDDNDYARQFISYLSKREKGQLQNVEDRHDEGDVSFKESKSFKKQVELLQEKVNLNITSNCKKDLLKQIRIASDALLTIYDIVERQNISQKQFEDLLDDAFSNVNELLTVLVVQETKI